ncbi:synaptopodin-2 [Betta splendens]|uniref:Synaptopodin-2 n=1 Tax=Betta splendens TaxID=158456 RepID=A0A6P7N3F6_BETSP|nr:synaptopodin-2 [Betta splendens]
MEPEAEDPDNDNLVPWSGSDGSQELCVSESLAESCNEDDVSGSEYPLDARPPHVFGPEPESAEHLQPQGWVSAGEQQSPPDESGSEEDVLYQEEDEVYLSESRGSVTESPHRPSSPSLSPQAQRHDSKPPAGRASQPHSPSSSSLGGAADMTLALTLTTQQPVGASTRQRTGTGNRRDQSSEEGGSSEAPPASVFFGISDEGAEQAERWNSGSDTDLCRPDRHGRRLTRLGHSESQSERHVKETKSKCKRIALLLTEAPNPQNKGALLFKKRRQRVEKYTLVSYGTGDIKFDREDQIEEDTEEVKSAAYNFVTTSDSEYEEEYSVLQQRHHLSLNWQGVGEMEELPETKGKGVLMFAQRRKRMDELVSEHEERMSKGSPVELLTEPECAEPQDLYDATGTYGDQADYMDERFKQHLEYQENIQQMNHPSNVPKALVPNRTAKPFLGFQDGASPVLQSGTAPATKKHETRFKVPVPINSNPQVWSPTGDIIASRHERISVPAIKTGILPESKRKSSKPSMPTSKSDLQLQGKGERRSYIESEEDCFSLGAEACNFMQPRSVKLKNPPPVAPKPTINPACPPWLSRSPPNETYVLPQSPVSPPSHSSAGPQGQLYLQQQDWVQPQQVANRWAPDQAQARLQTPPSAWAQAGAPPQRHLQPTTNSWSQLPRSPVSMQARSPTHSPHPPPVAPRSRSDSAPNSVASCPPHASKAPPVLPKARSTGKGVNGAGDGPTMSGKGAQLFAKRQSRMEKFVVDAEKVQANKPRSSSPSASLPNSWRYSSNVRAPPPLSYNPLLSPFYPPSATKQAPPASPQIKPKTKEKPKAKHLNSLDIMKHQPYQLDSSLFKYDAVPEAKSPKPAPASKFELTKGLKHRSASHSAHNNASEHGVHVKAEAPAKSPAPGFGRSRSLSLPRRPSSVASPGLLSPLSTPGALPPFAPTQRQAHKPLSPWEAASRSPIGSVDEAFVFQGLPSPAASGVRPAGLSRSLPEPPEEWKRRVSLEPPAVGNYNAAPGFQRRTFSPGKPASTGPPFRPAQPLGPASRPRAGFSPVKYSPLYSAVQYQ